MKGEIVYMIAFDVANELLPERAREVLGARVLPMAPRARVGSARAVAVHRPLAVALPAVDVPGARLSLRAEAHLYEFGAICIVLRGAFETAGLGDLAGLHEPVLADGRRLDDLARARCTEVCDQVRTSLVRPSDLAEPEVYTAFCIHDLSGETDAERWLQQHRTDVAALLCNLEPAAISSAQVDEVFRYHRSLEKGDAVVLDWDAGLVVDLSSDTDDVLFTIELANVQLEEFRQMDRSLDRFLNQAYADVERGALSRFGVSRAVLRKLRWFRIDLAKLADEVTNTTKYFGDWHLARVYLAARERFHIDRWKQSVEQRLAQLDQLYNLVRTEVIESRTFWLELIIVILFLWEVISGLRWLGQ